MVGIDIGSKTVKIVQIEKEGNNFNLISSGIVGYNGTPIEKMTDEKEMALLAGIIKKLVSEVGIKNKDIVLSVPESQVFTRTIKFPLLTDTEIASAVKWESEQYIPIPVTEAIIQHTILQRNETATPPSVLVLLVAAPRVTVEKYAKVLQLAGLTTIAVETELIALTRCLAPIDKTVLLVDLGATSTDIAIAKNGLLFFSRSIPIAGEAFTRAVSQGLGINAQQGEEYKKTYGMVSTQLEGKIKNALSPVLHLIVDEIKKAVNYFQTEEKGDVPSAIIVTGGTSGMPDIISTLSELTGMEVLVANPFAKVKVDPETLKKISAYSPLYSVAVGLAQREE